MKNLAIIPARSKSKGLPNKNIKQLNGKPLIAYSIEAALESKIFDEVMVSTDSEEYASIAKKYGASVPFLRSEKNSSDSSSSWDAVKEVLCNYEKNGKVFDNICLLQPTSPLRTYSDIIDAYLMLCNKNANCIISVCEMDHSPLWCNTIPDDMSLSNFINETVVASPRQSLPTFYRLNGAIYFVKKDYLLAVEERELMKKGCFAFVMEKNKSIDIDDELDFLIAEAIMKKGCGKE